VNVYDAKRNLNKKNYQIWTKRNQNSNSIRNLESNISSWLLVSAFCNFGKSSRHRCHNHTVWVHLFFKSSISELSQRQIVNQANPELPMPNTYTRYQSSWIMSFSKEGWSTKNDGRTIEDKVKIQKANYHCRSFAWINPIAH